MTLTDQIVKEFRENEIILDCDACRAKIIVGADQIPALESFLLSSLSRIEQATREEDIAVVEKWIEKMWGLKGRFNEKHWPGGSEEVQASMRSHLK